MLHFALSLGLLSRAAAGHIPKELMVTMRNLVPWSHWVAAYGGDSACAGDPAFAPKLTTVYSVNLDLGNFNCPLHADGRAGCSPNEVCDVQSKVLMQVSVEDEDAPGASKSAGEVAFQALGKNQSGTLSWVYSCTPVHPENYPYYRVTCDQTGDNIYMVTVEKEHKEEWEGPHKPHYPVRSLLGAADQAMHIPHHVSVTVDNKVPRSNFVVSRGSSACSGIPGIEKKSETLWDVELDLGNLNCRCCDGRPGCPPNDLCDWQSKIFMEIGIQDHDSFGAAAEISVQALGKNHSGTMSWTYRCVPLEPEKYPNYKVTCDETGTDAYKVTIEKATGESIGAVVV